MVDCPHDRIIPGLDGNWCPDCRKVLRIFPIRGEQLPLIPHSAGASEHQAVSVYRPGMRASRYYRYNCTRGHEILYSLHIPGGSIANPIAQARATEVRRWIALGRSSVEIVALIQGWRSGEG